MSGTAQDELVEIEMLGRREGAGDEDAPGGRLEAKKKKKRQEGLLELVGKLWQPRKSKYSRKKTGKTKAKFSSASTDEVEFSGQFLSQDP